MADPAPPPPATVEEPPQPPPKQEPAPQPQPPVAPSEPTTPPLTASSQDPAPDPTPNRRRRRREGGLKLGDNLSSMASVLEAKKAELKEQNAQDEAREYTVNPQINLDAERFQAALMGYADHLEGNNRMNLASILREGETVLHHNRWTFTLKDDLHKDLIVREDELVPYMRKKLETPDLFVEFRVAEDTGSNEPDRPYTDDQKLREMCKQNPHLEELQKIFKTRILY